MLRQSLPLLLSTALASSMLFACTTGTTRTSSSSGDPSPSGTSTSSTDPAPGKGSTSGSSGSSGSKGSTLGPSCQAYVECCDEVAAMQPSLAASCDSVQTQIESAQSNGASTASYESSCKSGLSTFQSAGYCK